MTIYNEKTIISINLAKNRATIKQITEMSIFNEGHYNIESDSHGYSELQQREDGIYEVEVLEGKVIKEQKIDESTAKDIIRHIIETRILDVPLL